MTNEEAIQTIKSNYPHERYTMLREALDMAMVLLAAESKPMIPWIKYDPANPPTPPESGEIYMVIDDCKIPWTGYFEGGFWLNDWDGNSITCVTHYAHINLPGEEDK